jgi:hypothetical protein
MGVYGVDQCVERLIVRKVQSVRAGACATGDDASSISRHKRGDPGGLYEEERQSLNPGFLAKASELAECSAEPTATDARARSTAGADRQATLDVVEIGTARLIARDERAIRT